MTCFKDYSQALGFREVVVVTTVCTLFYFQNLLLEVELEFFSEAHFVTIVHCLKNGCYTS